MLNKLVSPNYIPMNINICSTYRYISFLFVLFIGVAHISSIRFESKLPI